LFTRTWERTWEGATRKGELPSNVKHKRQSFGRKGRKNTMKKLLAKREGIPHREKENFRERGYGGDETRQRP